MVLTIKTLHLIITDIKFEENTISNEVSILVKSISIRVNIVCNETLEFVVIKPSKKLSLYNKLFNPFQNLDALFF